MLKNPNLNCSHCYSLKKNNNILPLCELATCPIESLATDIELNNRVERYIMIKGIGLSGNTNLEAKLLEENGFLNNIDEFFEMEKIFQTYINKKQQKVIAMQRAKQWQKKR